MKKLGKSRPLALFVSAVLILNQAAFLFIPTYSAHAEEGNTTACEVALTKPANGNVISGQGTAQVEVDTTIPDIVVELHWWSGSSKDYWTMKHQGGNVYTISWDTTTFADGEYQIQALVRAMYECISCDTDYYYSNTITVKVDNNVSPTVTLIKPADGATVSGQVAAQVQVDTTETVDEVIFYWSITSIGQGGMIPTGNKNEYQYSWDTTVLDDGKYYFEVVAWVGGQHYRSGQFGVKVDNASQTPSITVNIMEPRDGSTISGQGIVQAQVNTAETVDKVQLLYFGPSGFIKATNWGDMTPAGNKNEYQYSWDTTVLPDGKYKLKVRACVAGQDYYSQSITVAMENNAADPVDIQIEFINAPEYISGPVIISAQINMEVDEIFFDIFGPVGSADPISNKYTAIPEGANIYHFKWDINGLPDGPYKVKARVKKGALSTYKGTAVNIQRDMSVVNGDDMGNISTYLPECGVKKECSADGVCFEKSITYDNKEKMLNDGARLKYHGVCREDTGSADFYLPECGIKKDCSSGACFEKKKTYDNKSQMINDNAEFLYHGVCKSDDARHDDFEKMCEDEYAPVCGEIKICEGDFCRVQIQTFSSMCKLRVNRGRLLNYGGCQDQTEDEHIMQIEERSSLLANDQLDGILAELQELRNIVREQQNKIKYLISLVVDLEKITQQMQNSINNFITYGVDENTQKLGAGERAAVIHSFKSAFNKLPENEEELSDAIKIANGRWPSLRSEEAEENARNNFNNIYKRNPDTENPNDNAAVTVMAYGLRQKAENRNMDSERTGINTFMHIYGYHPDTTEDWNIMQAITYSGATR